MMRNLGIPLAPIERAEALIRLYTMLDVKTAGQGFHAPQLAGIVIPTVSVDAVMRLAKAVNQGGVSTGTGGTGNYNILTVPAAKRWHVYSFDLRQTSGDNTYSRVNLRDATTTVIHPFAYPSTVTAYTSGLLGTPLILDSGDSIQVLGDGAGTAASQVAGTAWVLEEDSFVNA